MNDQTEQPRQNAVEDLTLVLQDLTFRFTATPLGPFDVQIGATAAETDANLTATIKRLAEHNPAPPEPEPAATPDPVTFDEWFGRVQKWAQFNRRPIPDDGPNWRDEFTAGTNPADAGKKHCEPAPD